MKIKTGSIMALAVGMTLMFDPVMVSPETFKQQMKPVALQRINFSKAPQGVQLVRPPALMDIPPSPAPLSPQMRNDAINQIRGAVGLTPLRPSAPAGSVVPVHVVLTPDRPKSGLSTYAVLHGHHFPDPKNWEGLQQTIPFTCLPGEWESSLLFNFDTLPGKTYMIDLFVGPQRVFILEGVFSGNVSPQDAHIIIGFTANSRISFLKVRTNAQGFFFWRGELTQVN